MTDLILQSKSECVILMEEDARATRELSVDQLIALLEKHRGGTVSVYAAGGYGVLAVEFASEAA